MVQVIKVSPWYVCEMETELDWLASSPSYSWTIQRHKTCHCSFEFWQQMGQRFLSPDPIRLCTALLYSPWATDTYGHPLKSEHNRLSDSLMDLYWFWTLNKEQTQYLHTTVQLFCCLLRIQAETKTFNCLKLADLNFIKFISQESRESLCAQLQHTQANKSHRSLD